MGGTARGPAQSCTGALPLHERSYGSYMREHMCVCVCVYLLVSYVGSRRQQHRSAVVHSADNSGAFQTVHSGC